MLKRLIAEFNRMRANHANPVMELRVGREVAQVIWQEVLDLRKDLNLEVKAELPLRFSLDGVNVVVDHEYGMHRVDLVVIHPLNSLFQEWRKEWLDSLCQRA